MSDDTDADHRGPPVYGDWMGSAYGMSGHRYEWQLSIFLDGSYSKKVTDNRKPNRIACEKGTWSLEENSLILTFAPKDGDKTRWRIHEIAGLQNVRNVLVLRAAILASRNLPIMLHRVYPETHHTPLGAYGFPEHWPL